MPIYRYIHTHMYLCIFTWMYGVDHCPTPKSKEKDLIEFQINRSKIDLIILLVLTKMIFNREERRFPSIHSSQISQKKIKRREKNYKSRSKVSFSLID